VKTITLDGITWELPYWDLLPPLSAPAFEELKDDIEDKGGNVYPVLWTPLLGGDRRVIDGGHRLRAVSELRQEGHTAVALNEQCLTFTSLDEEKQAALDLNLKRRHLTPEQRAEWATRLRLHQGMSYPQIAETLGVSVGTAYNDVKASATFSKLKTSSDTITGKDGKTYPANRPAPSDAGEHKPAAFVCTDESLTAGAKILVTDGDGELDPLATFRLNQLNQPEDEPTEAPATLPTPEPPPLVEPVENKKGPAAILASGRDDHNTPPELLNVIRAFGEGITLDPCSNKTSTVGAELELTKEDDGLHASWAGLVASHSARSRGLTFVNPPYDQETLAHVNEKAAEDVQIAAELNFYLEVITLVPVKSDQPWFQAALYGSADAVCFIAGRVRFWADGVRQSGAAFESILLYYGERAEEFCDCFGEETGVCLNLKLYR